MAVVRKWRVSKRVRCSREKENENPIVVFAWGWKGEILWTQIRGLIQISSLLIQKMNGGLLLIYGASIEDTFFCVQWSLSCLVVKICKNVRKKKCLHRIAPETFYFLYRNGGHRGTIISVFHVVVMWPRLFIRFIQTPIAIQMFSLMWQSNKISWHTCLEQK